VLVFGKVHLVDDAAEQARLLHALLAKYFPDLEAGKHYRPVTLKELKRTTVYGLTIESWSGKENWKDQADQSDDWPPLDARL
jgi:nitroimidazol reductase NimA-like FMN-containing flavoprotein (pyridoxamine 5'-phosphate oxidase superfamily)